MKTFDYEKAWAELALPAFKQLPTAALCLVEEVGIVAADLQQGIHCDMIWPDDNGKLREMFGRLDSETLATAAHVVYYYSHWRPGGSTSDGAPVVLCGWKFSNYADQVLRIRFNLGRDVKSGVGLLIHEGTIRVCYSSRDSWTWHEVAPATDAGMAEASKIADTIRRKIDTQSSRDDRDSAAWKAFEAIKSTVAWPGFDTAAYMVEESELELRRAARMPKPDKEKLFREIISEFDKSVSNATAKRDGELWLVDHDLPTENAIYYNHTSQWCFGWRKPYVGEARESLLAALAKFPFPYDVK